MLVWLAEDAGRSRKLEIDKNKVMKSRTAVDPWCRVWLILFFWIDHRVYYFTRLSASVCVCVCARYSPVVIAVQTGLAGPGSDRKISFIIVILTLGMKPSPVEEMNSTKTKWHLKMYGFVQSHLQLICRGKWLILKEMCELKSFFDQRFIILHLGPDSSAIPSTVVVHVQKRNKTDRILIVFEAERKFIIS